MKALLERKQAHERSHMAAPTASPMARPMAPPMFDLIELLFFAYRDFVGDADRLLEAYNFGRAHHRVLHFVYRHPDLTIAELLDILKITKQSLNRVLKELLEKKFVEARVGVADRRQRRLTATPAGRKLALELAHLQSQRFSRVLEDMPEGVRQQATQFLLGMVDPAEQNRVSGLVWPQRQAPLSVHDGIS